MRKIEQGRVDLIRLECIDNRLLLFSNLLGVEDLNGFGKRSSANARRQQETEWPACFLTRGVWMSHDFSFQLRLNECFMFMLNGSV